VIRKAISHLEKDRILSQDIAAMKELIRNSTILRAVEKKVGELN
jgi:histidine ammonia-lyase